MEHRETVIAHLKKVIEGAALLEVPIVGTFIGKDKNKTVPQNLEDYAKVWPPIVKFAKDQGIKVAIENCPMLFSYDEWPSGNNLASTPAIWRKMWEIDWSKFFAALTAAHYDYVVSIEHEDRFFEGEEELVKRGFYIARDMLKPFIH